MQPWTRSCDQPRRARDREHETEILCSTDEGWANARLVKVGDFVPVLTKVDVRSTNVLSRPDDASLEGPRNPAATKEGNCNLETGVKSALGTTVSNARICNFCHATSTPLWRKAKLSGVDIVLCNACGLRYKKGKYCYFCQGIYYEDENKRPVNRQRKPDGKSWIGCAGCQHWCHLDCHVQCSKGGKFSCPKCRRTSSMENAVSNFGEATARLTKDCTKKIGHASPDPFQSEDGLQSNGQQMPLPNLMRKRKRLEARKLSSEEVAPKLEKARSWARALNQARDTIIIL
mmetsp:Transcript_11224/g.69321  ORF Transcript_11224/g.69321 Transcript_11224/m.69321 type:complete len:288 (-) Transcript_11224:1680-2543(-)